MATQPSQRPGGRSSPPRLYLAGPEVFLPDPLALAAQKCAILADLGLEGAFPLDTELGQKAQGLSVRALALAIAEANEDMMRACDGILANMTPYHGGMSLDVGTAFEIGFMRALGKPVFGYSNDHRPFADRVRQERYGGPATRRRGHDGRMATRGADGLEIEDFGLSENLMMVAAITASGGAWTCHPSEAATVVERLSDLTAFRQCAQAAADTLLGNGRAG